MALYITDETGKLIKIAGNILTLSSNEGGENSAIQILLDNKVDKVEGKDLSSNDYTDADKTKLNTIQEGANKTTVDSSLSTTSSNPVQNKIITEELNTKATTDDLNTVDTKFTAVNTNISNLQANVTTIKSDINTINSTKANKTEIKDFIKKYFGSTAPTLTELWYGVHASGTLTLKDYWTNYDMLAVFISHDNGNNLYGELYPVWMLKKNQDIQKASGYDGTIIGSSTAYWSSAKSAANNTFTGYAENSCIRAVYGIKFS